MPAYESAVVRVVRVNVDGTQSSVGVGVLVGRHEVVTCAHVVNAALDRDLRSDRQPDDTVRVQVEFPLIDGAQEAAIRVTKVLAWTPPHAMGEGGDVAGLRIVGGDEAPSGCEPAHFATRPPVPGTPLRAFGYPADPPRPDGHFVWVEAMGEVAGGLIQVEGIEGQSVKAQPGYSGSPVWDDETGLAIGILHSAPFPDEPAHDARLLPPRQIAAAWEEQFDYLLVPPNPYRGLEPFTVDHSDVFFGRDPDIDALATMVDQHPVVVVVGPSGVGKSSLVQAGLIPKLCGQRAWSVSVARPGDDPWHRIANALIVARRSLGRSGPTSDTVEFDELSNEIERLRSTGLAATAEFLRAKDRPLLLIIDQLEELLSKGEPDLALLDLILPEQSSEESAARVVITLRSDFLDALTKVPSLGARLNDRVYFLSKPSDENIREAVCQPASQRGVGFEDRLVDRIVADTREGSLPLLEFTLTQLWGSQRHKELRFAGYEAMGGVTGALDRFADQQLEQLPDAAASVVDKVLLRLVRTPAGDPDKATRQRVHEDEISDQEWQALSSLAEVRLVIRGSGESGPYAELAHEALIAAWRHLRALVHDNAGFLSWLDETRRRAAEGDPLGATRIDAARQWLDARPDDVPPEVKQFVIESETAVEAQVRQLTEARDHATALRLAADAELAARSSRTRTNVSVALGVESLLLKATPQGDSALRHALSQHRPLLRAFSPDLLACGLATTANRVEFAVGGLDDGIARVFSSQDGSELGHHQHHRPVSAIAMSGSGGRIATVSGGVIRVLDSGLATVIGEYRHRHARAVLLSEDGYVAVSSGVDGFVRAFDVDTAEVTPFDHGVAVSGAALRGDGTLIATAAVDGTVRLLNVETREPAYELSLQGSPTSVDFSADGLRCVVADQQGTATVIDTEGTTIVRRLDHDAPLATAVFAPDGMAIATVAANGRFTVFAAEDGDMRWRSPANEFVSAWAYSADGSILALGLSDGVAHIHDAHSGQLLSRIGIAGGQNDSSQVIALAVWSTPSRLVAATDSRTLALFNLDPCGEALTRHVVGSPVVDVSVSSSGTIAAASVDGVVRILSGSNGSEPETFAHPRPVAKVALSADGSHAASVCESSVRVWDVARARAPVEVKHPGGASGVDLTADGELAASVGLDGHLRVFRATGELMADRSRGAQATSVAIHPPGDHAVTGWADGAVVLTDLPGGSEKILREAPGAAVSSVAVSAHGSSVAYACLDGTVGVVDAGSGDEIRRLVLDPPVTSLCLSHDGSRLCVVSDGSAVVVDVATGDIVMRCELDGDNSISSARFDQDRGTLVVGAADGSVQLLELEAADLVTRALSSLPQPLSDAESARYGLGDDARHRAAWQRMRAHSAWKGNDDDV